MLLALGRMELMYFSHFRSGISIVFFIKMVNQLSYGGTKNCFGTRVRANPTTPQYVTVKVKQFVICTLHFLIVVGK